jgi:hypothetical protein
MRSSKGYRWDIADLIRKPGNIRLCIGMVFALLVVSVLVLSISPGVEGGKETFLSQAMLSEKAGIKIDSQEVVSRIVEQKFQIHMEESDQQAGDIPYVEVWVLNDPFYPLIGEVGDLRKNQGTLASKEWQMLGFPAYQTTQGGSSTGAAATSQSQPTVVNVQAASGQQRVLMLKEVYEIRGIRYATITVNDQAYDKLKVGSEFADTLKVQEIVDNQTVKVTCGDETFELKVNQLRKV